MTRSNHRGHPARIGLLAGLAWTAAVSAQAHRHAGHDAAPPIAPQGVLLPDLTPGYVLVEGDIQVRLDHYLARLAGAEATFGPATYWGGGVVPFVFDGNVTLGNQQLMLAAMAAIEQRAGVDFRPVQAGDPNWLHIQNSAFNSSPVGIQGGAQNVNIFNWDNQIIMVHELYHALGFRHEQSRSDRNIYVTINYANICGAGACQCLNAAGQCFSCSFNFDIITNSSVYGDYDFDSFMHYAPNDFSCTGLPTISLNAPWNAASPPIVIGQRDHFSYMDRITCRGIYPFAEDRWLDKNYFGTQAGTLFQPWNTSFQSAMAFTPDGGTLYFRYPGSYSAIGLYNVPRTIESPLGVVTLGN